MSRFSRSAVVAGIGVLASTLTGVPVQQRVSAQSSAAVAASPPATAAAAVVNAADGDDGLTEVVDNGDGTKTMRVSLAPRGKKGADRVTKKFDSKLKRQGQRWKATSAEDEVSFGLSTTDASVVSVGSAGRSLSLGRPSATAFASGKQGKTGKGCNGKGVGNEAKRAACSATGTVVGSSIRFDGAFGEGGDLVYDVSGSSVKERIILDTPPEPGRPVEFRFPLAVQGLKAYTAPDGSLAFADASGVAFKIPAGFAWDSRYRRPGNDGVPIGASVVKVAYALEDGGATLVLKVDERWLTDPVREYPVTIDPTIEIGRGSYNSISNRLAPGAGATGQVLNGSFETGWAPWNLYSFTGTTNIAVYDNASMAQSGTRYLSTNTDVAGGSVYQDVPMNLPALKPVTMSMWLRAETPTASGTMCAFLFPVTAGLTTHSGCKNVAVTNAGWKRFEVVAESPFDVYAVRVQYYPGVGSGTSSLDSISLNVGSTAFQNGSFEHSGTTGWTTIQSTMSNVWNPAVANDSGRYLSIVTGGATGSVYQDVAAVPVGQPLTASAWVRSAGPGSAGVSMCVWLLGTGTPPTCEGQTAVPGEWTRVAVTSQSTQTATTRVELYAPPNSTVLMDSVSLHRVGTVSWLAPADPPPNYFGHVYAGEGLFGNWYGQTQHSRLRFQLPPSLTGATINSAVLRTFVRHCDHVTSPASNGWAGGTLPQYANPIHVRRMTSDFDTNVEAVTDDKTSLVGGPMSYANVDVTDYARLWAAEPGSNYGVRLDMGQIPGNAYGYCRIASNSYEFAGDLAKTTYLEVTYNESQVANKRYHPVTPVRVVDTRNQPSPNQPAYYGAKDFTLTGATGVPTSASSVVANVTVVTSQTQSGLSMVYPAGTDPGRNINVIWNPGEYGVTNQAIVPLGISNQITVNHWGSAAHTLIDVIGYFDDGTPASATGGRLYTALSGSRVGIANVAAGGTQVFRVAGLGGVPATGVDAAAVTITAIGQGGAAGSINATANTDPLPPAYTTLTMTSPTDFRSAFAIVKLGTDGHIRIKSDFTAAQIFIDVQGYFSSNPATGAGFMPLVSQRLIDTRDNGGAKRTDYDITVADGAGVSAAVVNILTLEPDNNGNTTAYPSGETPPVTNSLNYLAGKAAAATAIVRLSGDGRIHIRNSVPAHNVIELLGFVATSDQVAITGQNLLRNGSFEIGSTTTAQNWDTNTTCGDLPNQFSYQRITANVNAGDRAEDGNAYLRIQGTSATASGSVCQNVPFAPVAGTRYTFSLKARAMPGNVTGRGYVELKELASPATTAAGGVIVPGTTRESAAPLVLVDEWQERVSLTFCARESFVGYGLRVKIYAYGTTPFDIDTAQLTTKSDPICLLNPGVPYSTTVPAENVTGNNLYDGGMNTGSEWVPCQNPVNPWFPVEEPNGPVAISVVAQTLGSRGNALSVRREGGPSACRSWDESPRSVANGEQYSYPHYFSAWVRSGDGSNFKATLSLVGYVRQEDAACLSSGSCANFHAVQPVEFTATSVWQKITVVFWPPQKNTHNRYVQRNTYQARISPIQNKVLLVDEAAETGIFVTQPECEPSFPGCDGTQLPTPGCSGICPDVALSVHGNYALTRAGDLLNVSGHQSDPDNPNREYWAEITYFDRASGAVLFWDGAQTTGGGAFTFNSPIPPHGPDGEACLEIFDKQSGALASVLGCENLDQETDSVVGGQPFMSTAATMNPAHLQSPKSPTEIEATRQRLLRRISGRGYVKLLPGLLGGFSLALVALEADLKNPGNFNVETQIDKTAKDECDRSKKGGGRTTGPVCHFLRTGWTEREIVSAVTYVHFTNAGIRRESDGKYHLGYAAQWKAFTRWARTPGRVSTSSVTERFNGASETIEYWNKDARTKERDRAKAAGVPYQFVVGHLPDRVWMGHYPHCNVTPMCKNQPLSTASSDPFHPGESWGWLDQEQRPNACFGRDSQNYDNGFEPTEFRLYLMTAEEANAQLKRPNTDVELC